MPRQLSAPFTAVAAALALAACATEPAPAHGAHHGSAGADHMHGHLGDVPEKHTVYVSSDSFARVEARLRDGIQRRDLALITVVDHAGQATQPIRANKLFLVGNPELGTPFIAADPLMGIHLPLKILIHDAADGTTHLAYSHPGITAAEHDVKDEVSGAMEQIHDTMRGLLQEAAGSTVRVINPAG